MLGFLSIKFFDMRNTPSEVIAVVGHPVSHSISPTIHSAAFKHLGANAEYLSPWDVEPKDAPRLAEEMRTRGIRQLAVTIPHKEVALQVADEVSPIARQIGAANTLTRQQDDTVHADNTDWIGVRDSLTAHGSWEGKRALVTGAGGAARGSIHALRQLGMDVYITNRTRERAATLIDEFGIQWGDIGDRYDLLLNVTPVGMKSLKDPENITRTPVDRAHLRSGMTVFDTIPNPLETRLLREAKEAGCETIDGMRMLVFQAIEQLRIWTAVADPDLSRRVNAERKELASIMRAAALEKLGVTDG